MKAADFAISQILPEDLRQSEYDLSKKGVSVLMASVASKYPDQFREVSKKIGDLGRNAAWYQGYTTGAQDTRPVIDTSKYYKMMDAELADIKKQNLNPKDFTAQREEVLMKYSDAIDKDTMSAALKNNNSFARAVASGARGNSAHVKAILSTPGIYTDSNGNIIPMFVRNSFSGGVRPAEALAGTYGARLAVTCLRHDTEVRMADGGIKMIRDIEIGDLVVGADTSGNCFPVRVSDVFNQGQQPLFEHTFRSGNAKKQFLKVFSTLEHKFLFNDTSRCERADKSDRVTRHITSSSVYAIGCDRPSKSVITIPASPVPKQNNLYTKSRLMSSVDFGMGECFDIEVDHPDHLFVLANGVITSNSTKRATAKGGDLAKILSQNTSNYNITEKDCGASNGIDLDPSDESLTGRVLARPVGDITAGTVIDRSVAAQLRRQKEPVIVRSALTCQSAHGLCSRCVGLEANGKFPHIGDSVGITAGHSISEPIVQGSLNTKHNSGMAKGKKSYSGFDYISQFVQVPDDFRDRAAVSEKGGTVSHIEEAPQGGNFITVDGHRHFALPGFGMLVKPGDKVEAGDQLSEGLVNPADIVRLRGLGEGRRYYAERLGQILSDSGNTPDRRNMEIVARSTVDSYKATDPDQDSPYLPDDSVRESDFMSNYVAPDDTVSTPVHKAERGYLQQPVLHYTVGTQLTPKMLTRMKGAGVEDVMTSKTKPWFDPEMKRLRVASHDSKDWIVGLGTSYLSSQMRGALERGDETNVKSNYHFGPRLAYGADAGSGAFGENVGSTGKF